MLTLPADPWRALLTSFWLAVGLLVAVVASAACWALDGSWWAGVVAGAAVAVGGLVLPDRGRAAYRRWNAAGRTVARALRRIGLAAWYRLVVVPAAYMGRPEEFAPDGQPSWAPRGTLPNSGYASAGWPPPSGRGSTDTLRWLTTPRRAWAIALVPLLLILALVGDDTDDAPSTTVYTLY